MGNCVVCCAPEHPRAVCADDLPRAVCGDDLEIPGQSPRPRFSCLAAERQLKVHEVEPETEASSAGAAPASVSHFPQNVEAEPTSETMIEFQECGTAASQSNDAQQSADVHVDEPYLETMNGSSKTVKPPVIEWGSYISPTLVSDIKQGGVCNLCRGKLSGAITMAMCGHIFHDRCVTEWKSNVCPSCQKHMDEPTEKHLDRRGVPIIPIGTPVMLQGLIMQKWLNGTYGQVVDYCDKLRRYTVRQQRSLILYSVRSRNVVNIMLE